MSEKRVHRITLFFADSELAALAEDAQEADREPADYLRSLWRADRKRRDEARAETVRAWAIECERKQRQLDALSLRSVPVERDSEWPDTVQTR
jgi:hypothetical protein